MFIAVALETVNINITGVYQSAPKNWVNVIPFFELPSVANLQFVSSLSRQKTFILVYYELYLFYDHTFLLTMFYVYIKISSSSYLIL